VKDADYSFYLQEWLCPIATAPEVDAIAGPETGKFAREKLPP